MQRMGLRGGVGLCKPVLQQLSVTEHMTAIQHSGLTQQGRMLVFCCQ